MTEYGEVDDHDVQDGSPKINCLKCKHLKITWDPKFPRACKVFGFKGKELPSVTVKKVTGKPCPSFEPMTRKSEDN